MAARFVFEVTVGLVGMISVLLFGMPGMATLALFAFFPLVVRKSMGRGPDERELQLFYRTGNITFGLIFIALPVIYFASNISINGNLIGDSWYALSIASIFLLHGITGLLIFRSVG